jgi:hypothetical protein
MWIEGERIGRGKTDETREGGRSHRGGGERQRRKRQ